jgi:hypothetical protein
LHAFLAQGLTLNSKSARDLAFGQAFRALGHVIHHIQDMAQPQHTRDDAHPPFSEDELYENFTRDRFKKVSDLVAAYGSTTYPVPGAPSFHKARDYWTSEAGGMADYSHAGFVTTETNFFFDGTNFVQHPAYPTPEPILPPVVMTVSQVAQAFPSTPSDIVEKLNQLGGLFYFFAWSVLDEFTAQTTPNNFNSTFSVFSADLQGHNSCGPLTPCLAFKLNRFNFQAANDLLLPRAIAYSTGLINHVALPGFVWVA